MRHGKEVLRPRKRGNHREAGKLDGASVEVPQVVSRQKGHVRRGFIEEWGRGTLKMAELATSAGLPRPEIEEHRDCVTARFRRADYVPTKGRGGDVIKRQEAILSLLEVAKDGLALREIAAGLSSESSERQIKRALSGLHDRGLAKSTGRGPGARWRRIRSGESE